MESANGNIQPTVTQTCRRRWLRSFGRISLRMVLVFVTLASVFTATVARDWLQRQRELAFIDRLRQELESTLVVESNSRTEYMLCLNFI